MLEDGKGLPFVLLRLSVILMGYPVLQVVRAPFVDDDNIDPAELAQLRDAVLALTARFDAFKDHVNTRFDELENRVSALEHPGGASATAASTSSANTSNKGAAQASATTIDRKKKRVRD